MPGLRSTPANFGVASRTRSKKKKTTTVKAKPSKRKTPSPARKKTGAVSLPVKRIGQKRGTQIQEPEVLIFGKQQCSHCKNAVKFAEQKGLSYWYTELDNTNGPQVLELINHSQNTIPFVFVRGKFIGGYRELLDMYS